MTSVGSETLTVGGPPCADNLILGDGEKEIAITVETNLIQGPFLSAVAVSFFCGPKLFGEGNGTHMARQQDRSHVEGATRERGLVGSPRRSTQGGEQEGGQTGGDQVSSTVTFSEFHRTLGPQRQDLVRIESRVPEPLLFRYLHVIVPLSPNPTPADIHTSAPTD